MTVNDMFEFEQLPDGRWLCKTSKAFDTMVFVAQYAKQHNLSLASAIIKLEKNGVIERSDLNEQKR